MSLSPDELDRYARHLVLREVGGPGQRKLNQALVTVVGAGGLGSPALLYLVAAGVGRLRIVDDDVVGLSNLQRQVLYRTGDIGRPKTDSAGDALAALNPHTALDQRRARLTVDNAGALLSDSTLVLDGSDGFDTRQAVNAACVSAGIPLVSGAIAQWEGQLSLFDPASGTPCYACIFPEPPARGQVPSCAEAGVMGALAGVVGAMMAGEAIKHITGAGKTLAGELLIYDNLWGETRKVAVNRRKGCAICG